ncbi:MAG: rod shape-determining protein MreD, partial [Chloroflexi bacterium]|nr:rod shape-determining protein MreD [Chloroflexota bacterium]
MTQLLLGIGLLPLAALLQSSVLPHLPFAALRPDLMLVIVLAWNLARSHRDGLLWAFAGGLLLDTLSAGPFGAMLLALFVVSLTANFIGAPLWNANPLLPLLGT